MSASIQIGPCDRHCTVTDPGSGSRFLPVWSFRAHSDFLDGPERRQRRFHHHGGGNARLQLGRNRSDHLRRKAEQLLRIGKQAKKDLFLSLRKPVPLYFGYFFDQLLHLLLIVHRLPDTLLPGLGDADLAVFTIVTLNQIQGSVRFAAGSIAGRLSTLAQTIGTSTTKKQAKTTMKSDALAIQETWLRNRCQEKARKVALPAALPRLPRPRWRKRRLVKSSGLERAPQPERH